MLRQPRALVAALLLVVTAPIAAQKKQAAPDLAGFDQWVTATMAEWKIPGLAVGAIKDGKVVYAKGFGYRDVEARLPVTPATIMAIGSNSKSFTTVLMAMLVDEKKLDWDKPIRNYLPDFEMWDEFATREMTGKDLVTHRSGLPRHDNLWYGRAFTREELFHRLKYLEPTYSFRTRYQYQNLMFMTAGYLTEKITGQSWDQQIQNRIFGPLGMSRSSTSAKGFTAGGDIAFPYQLRHDSLVRVPYRNLDAVGPAGSINSSVEEMLRYIQLRIDQGEYQGKRLVSVAAERQLQSPQMVSGGMPSYPELGHGTYGLGLGVSTYRGKKIVSHGGGIDGFISSMSWLPDDKIGIMVLTNLSGNNPVPTLVMRTLYDRLLGAPAVDWVARQRKDEAEGRARSEKAREARKSERKSGTSPSHALEAYAGRYEHPGYGTVDVAVDGKDLVLTMDSHQVRLTHYHYDVFEISDNDNVVPFDGLVRMLTSKKGVVDQLAIPLEPNVADIVFTRK